MVRTCVTWDVLLVLLNPPQDLTSCRAGARPGHPISGCEQSQQSNPYSITSSASESRLSEILMPSAFAVLRLDHPSWFLIYPSLWAIIVYGAVMHIRSVRPQANRALFFGRGMLFRKFQEQPRSLRD